MLSLFETILPSVRAKSRYEIKDAVNEFCKVHPLYNGVDDIAVDDYTMQPLIFLLFKQYERDSKFWSSCIKDVFNRYPDSRKAQEYDKTIIHCVVESGSLDLLKVFHPTAEELCQECNGRLPIEAAFSDLDQSNRNSCELVEYIVRIMGSKVDDERIRMKMLQRFRSCYLSAIHSKNHQDEFHEMQKLIDLRLVDLQSVDLNDSPPALVKEFQRGLWFRNIASPTEEMNILETREELSDQTLREMRHSPERYYTPYSPASFGCSLAKYRPYESMGVIIDVGEGPFAYWHDGTGGEMLSRDMDFSKETLLNPENYSCQFDNVTRKKIVSHIRSLQKSYMKTAKKNSNVHGVKDRAGSKISIPQFYRPSGWNEGLLRYKKSHIIGIYVASEDRNSIRDGLILKKALNLSNISLYRLSDYEPKICLVAVEELLQKYNFSEEELNPPEDPKVKSERSHIRRCSNGIERESSEEESISADETNTSRSVTARTEIVSFKKRRLY
jgi:hypothetical protein